MAYLQNKKGFFSPSPLNSGEPVFNKKVLILLVETYWVNIY
jgi:hypothetical protein